MPKVLLAVLFALVALPLAAARHRDARRGAREMLVGLLVFTAVYLGFLVVVYVPHYAPEWFK